MSRGAARQAPVICLMGPTATGKTDLALALAERFPVDIVSVDSAMVYRGMDVGTAKPSASVLARVPHRLIDVADPAEAYSAARFRSDAVREIRAIRAHGRIALLVGGTMLYFAALQRGLSDLPPADAGVRQALAEAGEREGWPALHRRLAALDPESARRIHPNDRQRIQRALEIHALTGRTRAQQYRRARPAAPWPLLRIALVPGERARLHRRIEERFHAMMAAGFLEEVAGLHARDDLSLQRPALRAVGYRQLWQHLDGVCSRAQAVERGIIATRQLAKRQMTWLRREAPHIVVDSESRRRLETVLNELRTAGLMG